MVDGEKINAIRTVKNDHGICAYSVFKDYIILAYPSKTVGTIQINNLPLSSEVIGEEKELACHNNPISMLKMNLNGTLLASVSRTGQNIKIYDINTLVLLYDFRRGSEMAEICNMEFCEDNKYFICTSNRCTLHIFYLTGANAQDDRKKNPVKFFEKISSVVKKIGDDKYVTKQSSFAQIKFETPSICAVYDQNKVIAINSFGCLIGEFNEEKGGEGAFSSISDFTH